MTLARRRVVRVPASSANLGPGFDVLAVALSLHLELDGPRDGPVRRRHGARRAARPEQSSRARVRAPASGRRVRVSDRFEDPPFRGPRIERGGDRRRPAGGRSPVRARRRRARARGRARGPSRQCRGGARGRRRDLRREPRARFDPPMGLEAALVVPSEAVATAEARAALPASVPLADAVFNVAHAALLVRGLSCADWELIAAGLDDRLHQPARAHLYPRSAELLERAPSFGALGATFSGAGPTVLVWCRYEQTGAVIDAADRASARLGEGDAGAVRVPGRRRAGALALTRACARGRGRGRGRGARARTPPGWTPRGRPDANIGAWPPGLSRALKRQCAAPRAARRLRRCTAPHADSSPPPRRPITRSGRRAGRDALVVGADSPERLAGAGASRPIRRNSSSATFR